MTKEPQAVAGEGEAAGKPRPPLTPRGRRTRARLLAASRTLFARDGFANVKIADLTSEAEVAAGSFYNYFQSKEEIFREMISEVIDEVLAVTGHGIIGQTTFERVHLTIQRYMEAVRPVAGVFAALDEAAAVHPEFATVARRNRIVFVDRAERGIRRLQDEGEVDNGLNPRIAAGALVAMTHNYTAWVWSNDPTLNDTEVALHLATLWVRGIGADTTGMPG